MYGRCDIHNCDKVLHEMKNYPGKTVDVCPKCEEERMKIYSSGLPKNDYTFKPLWEVPQ